MADKLLWRIRKLSSCPGFLFSVRKRLKLNLKFSNLKSFISKSWWFVFALPWSERLKLLRSDFLCNFQSLSTFQKNFPSRSSYSEDRQNSLLKYFEMKCVNLLNKNLIKSASF